MTRGLSRREFARDLGMSVGYVQKLVDAGRCVLTSDGKIDGPASRVRIAETADPGRQDVADRHAAARAAAGRPIVQSSNSALQMMVPPSDCLPDDAAIDLADNRAEAKALLMRYENGLIRIESGLRRGVLFERSVVGREAHGLGAIVRAGIERVIDQTAPRLAAAASEDDRRRILGVELMRLRFTIKRELPRALRRMRDGQKSTKGTAA